MNASKAIQPCVRLSNAIFSKRLYATPAKANRPIHPGYTKIKEKYKKFQADDGVPIHLKGGPFDKVVYYGTLVSCGIGLLMCAEYYYSAGFPKKD